MRGGSLLKLLSKGVGLRAALLANNFRSVVFKLRHRESLVAPLRTAWSGYHLFFVVVVVVVVAGRFAVFEPVVRTLSM